MLADQIFKTNFCHWLLDWVTRIPVCAREDNSIFKYIVADYSQKFQKDTFRSLGVDDNNIINMNYEMCLKVDRLIVSSSSGRDFRHSKHSYTPWAQRFFQNSFVPIKDHKLLNSNRIYISRNKSNRRRITNEDDLVDLIKPYGFRKVYLEDLSLTEQASLFYLSKVIISPHGAGLSNVVFCRPQTKIMEIFSPYYGTASFYGCVRTGVEYYCSNGIEPDYTDNLLPDPTKKGEYQKRDITVNLDSIQKFLNEI